MTSLEEYIKERDAALSTLDMEWAAQQMPYAAPEVRIMALHKARVESTGVSEKLRQESLEWLRVRGLHKLRGYGWADGWPTLDSKCAP